MKSAILILFLGILSAGCSNSIKSEKDLYMWLETADKGFVSEKKIEALKLKVKFLPPQFLAYNELNRSAFTRHDYDSLVSKYSKFSTFLFTVSIDDSISSLKYLGAQSYGDYKQRILDFNFNADQFLSLKTSKGEFKPVLSTLENGYNIDRKKTMYVVFSGLKWDDLKNEKKFTITYDDYYFETGINNFTFNSEKLINIPELSFLKFNI